MLTSQNDLLCPQLFKKLKFLQTWNNYVDAIFKGVTGKSNPGVNDCILNIISDNF